MKSQDKKSLRIEEKIGILLKKTGTSISTAESCTGGQISHLLTMVSGSSSYYLGSVISYAVSIKESVLGVSKDTIEQYGVVSAEVALEMAEGVRALTGSTYAVSTTGLAEGSNGVYQEGTVWIGISGPKGSKSFIFHCSSDRKGNIRRFANAALQKMYNYISKDVKY